MLRSDLQTYFWCSADSHDLQIGEKERNKPENKTKIVVNYVGGVDASSPMIDRGNRGTRS
jgi:hypothetical protein